MADWQIIALIAAFISVMVAALLLMFSRIFDFKMLEQAAKSEIVFAASTVLVVLLLIGLVQYGTDVGKNISAKMYERSYKDSPLRYMSTDASGNEIESRLDSSIFSSSEYTLVEIAILYMRSVMYCMEDVSAWVFRVSMAAHQISPSTQDVFMHYPISAWSWGGIAQIADNFLNTVYFMELVYRIQIYVLRFLDIFSVSYLLPIGILLRAFPPTRGAGAYAIALTLGLYLVFPLSYLAAVFSSPYPNLCTTPEIPLPILSQTTKGGLMGELMMWYRAFEKNILGFFGDISNYTNALMVNLCFLPFLAFTITITFVQASSGLFGASIPEVGRGLFKLI